MIFLFFSVLWFIVAAVIHILINKARYLVSVPRSYALLVFVIGGIACAVSEFILALTNNDQIRLPITSMLLYVTCSVSYISITASPTLGDQSPSSKIVLSLLHKGSQNEKQILVLFTEEEVLGKRLKDLVDSGCVEKKKTKYFVTKRGMLLASVFINYRKLLGISEGG